MPRAASRPRRLYVPEGKDGSLYVSRVGASRKGMKYALIILRSFYPRETFRIATFVEAVRPTRSRGKRRNG